MDYGAKYPELTEFPQALFQLLTLGEEKITFDLPLIQKFCSTIPICFSQIVLKDQYVE